MRSKLFTLLLVGFLLAGSAFAQGTRYRDNPAKKKEGSTNLVVMPSASVRIYERGSDATSCLGTLVGVYDASGFSQFDTIEVNGTIGQVLVINVNVLTLDASVTCVEGDRVMNLTEVVIYDNQLLTPAIAQPVIADDAGNVQFWYDTGAYPTGFDLRIVSGGVTQIYPDINTSTGGGGGGGTECSSVPCNLNASTTLGTQAICLLDGTNCPPSGGVWSSLSVPVSSLTLLHSEWLTEFEWTTLATTGGNEDMFTLSVNHNSTVDSFQQQLFTLERKNGAGTLVWENMLRIQNLEMDASVTNAIIISSSAGTIGTALNVSDPEIDMAININANTFGANGLIITGQQVSYLFGGIDLGAHSINSTAGSEVFGTLPVAAFDGGSNASASTYLDGAGEWTVPAGSSGDVSGPASSVDNEPTCFDSTTGKIIKACTQFKPAGIAVDLEDANTRIMDSTLTEWVRWFIDDLATNQDYMLKFSTHGGVGQTDWSALASPTYVTLANADPDSWTLGDGTCVDTNGLLTTTGCSVTASPAGSTTEVQYNQGGVTSAEAAFFYTEGTNVLHADGGFESNPTSTPGMTFDDLESLSETQDWTMFGNATDVVDLQEDVDITIGSQINSALTNWFFADASLSSLFLGVQSATGNGTILLPDDAIGPDEIDSTTGAYDFSGVTSFQVPTSASRTMSTAGEVHIDTTESQFVYRSGAANNVLTAKESYCQLVKDPPTDIADEMFYASTKDMTVSTLFCICQGTCAATKTTIDLEIFDASAGTSVAVTGTATCDGNGTETTAQALTVNTAVGALDYLQFNLDLTNTGDNYMVCVVYEYDQK